MVVKKYLLFSLLLSMCVYADNGDTPSPDVSQENQPTASLSSVEQSNASTVVNAPALDSLEQLAVEELNAMAETPLLSNVNENSTESKAEKWAKSEFSQALQQAGFSAGAAVLLLNNSFGRIALLGFLGYKSAKNFKKCFDTKENRNQNMAKGFSYLVAALLLSQDGYKWILSHSV
ncbi:MAG: hypothetical protein WD055_06435 [Candidatus Dependentiae bacterium]